MMERAGIVSLVMLVCMSMPCERIGVGFTQAQTDSTATFTELIVTEIGTDLKTSFTDLMITASSETTEPPITNTTSIWTTSLAEATTESMTSSSSELASNKISDSVTTGASTLTELLTETPLPTSLPSDLTTASEPATRFTTGPYNDGMTASDSATIFTTGAPDDRRTASEPATIFTKEASDDRRTASVPAITFTTGTLVDRNTSTDPAIGFTTRSPGNGTAHSEPAIRFTTGASSGDPRTASNPAIALTKMTSSNRTTISEPAITFTTNESSDLRTNIATIKPMINATTTTLADHSTIETTEATIESTSKATWETWFVTEDVTTGTEATTLPITTIDLTTGATTNPVTPTELITTEKPPTEPPAPTPRPGPVPKPNFPIIDGDPEKTYRFEVAVVEDSADGCLSSNLTSTDCTVFKASFTEKLMGLYNKTKPAGFKNVTDVKLKAGSIIVDHTVVYSYNDMDDADKALTATQMYDATVGMAVIIGYLNEYELQECDSCAPPAVTSAICSLEVQCAEAYATPVCPYEYWICESVCYHDAAYECGAHGLCRQESLVDKPICSCDWDSSSKEWYWGYNCQYFIDQTWMIIGCSCGGAVFLVFLIALIVYACCCKSSSEQTNKNSIERLPPIDGFQNMSFAHTEMFPAIDDLDEGDIVSHTRPYSYLHASPEERPSNELNAIQRVHSQLGKKDNNVPKPQEASPQRQSNPVSHSPPQTLESPRANGPTSLELRPQDFWGNVAPLTGGEQIQLNPVLDHIDTNERFKLQRPRISMNGVNGMNGTAQSPPSRPMSMPYSSYATHVTSDPRYHDMHTRAPSNRYSIPEPDYSYQR